MQKIKDFFEGIFTAFEFILILLILVIGYPFYKNTLKEIKKAIIEHKQE
ncbi:MAG: hypothetical protein LIO62_04150 [Clostridiales bacterium]|nr:hypothetical protein [Clostridiales bacterium]